MLEGSGPTLRAPRCAECAFRHPAAPLPFPPAGYMTIVSMAFFALTGTIGFYACYIFVRKIYSAVKID